ncbi:MAG: lamin tail domain-containing protein [Elusimicrobiota bacterium]
MIGYSSITALTNVTLTVAQSSYSWRVNVEDRALNYTTSTARYSVVVDTTPPPEISVLTSPVNGHTTNQMTLNFSWGSVVDVPAGVRNYILQLSTTSGFGVINYSSAVPANQAGLTLPQSTYYWRVNTQDNALNYTTSTLNYTLLVDTTPPSLPSLLVPDDNTSHGTGNITFDWTDSDDSGFRGASGISNYELHISSLISFATLTYSETPTTSTANTTLTDRKYWWRVRTGDYAGNYSAWTSTRSFIVDFSSPVLTKNSTWNEAQWFNSDPQTISPAVRFDIDFTDLGSGVTTGQYSISGAGIGWTDIFNIPTGTQAYTSNWGLQSGHWGLLTPGTNYVSVRGFDKVNLSTSVPNLFLVLKDTEPPAGITNLTCNPGISGGEILLSWTAPQDIPSGVESYLVKYTTGPQFINRTDFLARGTTFYQSWTPLLSSQTENKSVTGLIEGSTYYIGILSKDRTTPPTNYSPLLYGSTNQSSAQRVAPARITTLAGSSPGDLNPSEVRLTWTAVGDDGTTGNASGYVVKYATYAFTSAEWNSSVVSTYTQSWTPLSSGSQEEKVLSMPQSGTTYYFAIRVFDDASPGENYSLMSNTVAVQSRPTGPADGMIVFPDGTSGTPKYRKYTAANNSWGTTSDAAGSAGTVRWAVLRACPTIRNEKLLGIQSGGGTEPDGRLYLQRWNGSTWAGMSPLTPSSQINSTKYDSRYRAFDIAYEQTNGRAMIVFSTNGVGAVQYHLWSSTAEAFVIYGGTVPLSGSSGVVRWVRLEPQPGTNRIMLSALDANNDLYSICWNGSSWVEGNMNTVGTAVNIYQCYDVAWELTSGRCLVLWAEGTATQYKIYTPGTGWGIATAGPNPAATVNWIKLASDRVSGTNRIGASILDASGAPNDWWVSIWEGSSWINTTEISASMDAATQRLMDIAWEKDGRCIVVGVQNAAPASSLSYAIWSAGWSGLTTLSDDLGNSVDLRWLQLIPDPNSNKMIVAGTNANTSNNASVRTQNWSGTSWSGVTAHTALAPSGTYECAVITLDRHDTVAPTFTNNQSGDGIWRSINNGVYDVDFFDTGDSKLSKVQTQLASGSGGSGVYRTWTDEITGINAESYTTNWGLTGTTWQQLNQGKTFISLKIFDGVGNNVSLTDAFYVQKDTQPPTITNNMAGGLTTWFNNNPGAVMDIDFADQSGLSLLSTAQYLIYAQSNMTGSQIVVGTIFNYAPSRLGWTDNFGLNTGHWELLLNSTNYVSVRCFDVAGSTRTAIDAFVVLKDTVPPAGITGLSALPGGFKGAIALTWTAPSDTGSGKVRQYMIKYSSTVEISTDGQFDSAMTWPNNIIPSSAGTTENITLTGLDINTTYYFRLKSKDVSEPVSLSSWSVMSSSAGCRPQRANVYINDIVPSLSAGSDWVELFSNLSASQTLNGWTLVYNQGSIDSPGSESTVWTGGAAHYVSSGGFFVIDGLSLDSSQSYHVQLRDNLNRLIDIVQWPAGLVSGNSFSRITDGNDNYFEIDPTPTKNYANHTTTGVIKLNEIDYVSSEEFIEIYNSSDTVQSMTGWSVRNYNNIVFRWTRQCYPRTFSGLCWTSVDNTGKTWTNAFGSGGLDSVSDFVVLENNSGQVIDRTTWQSGSTYRYRNYKGQLVSYGAPAPGGAVSGETIGRQPSEGADTDNDSNDWIVFSASSLGRRNNNPTPATTNNLGYPASDSFIPRRAKLELTLGSDSSGGWTDTLWFVRTGGSADNRSPHIYRLTDLGFVLSSISAQTTRHVWINRPDIDGWTLINGTIYKCILNTDTGSGATPQIIPSNITYDASVHTISVVDCAKPLVNNGKRTAMLRADIKSNSPSGANAIGVSMVKVKLTDGSGTALTTLQAQSIFGNIYLIADSLTSGSTGVYQYEMDTGTAAHASSSEISLDGDGYQTINLSTPNTAGRVSAGQSKIYFMVVDLTDNADSQSPNNFRAGMDADSDTTLVDMPSLVYQDIQGTSLVTSVSSYAIAPASAPAGTYWPYDSGTITTIESTPEIYDKIYVGMGNGTLIALSDAGEYNSDYAGTGVLLTPLRSDYWTGENNYVYFVSKSGYIYKNTTANSNVWTRTLSADISSDFSAYTSLYAGTSDGRFYRLDTSGADVWSPAPTLPSGAMAGSPVIDDGFSTGIGESSVWVGTNSGWVYRLKLLDATVLSSTYVASAITTSICYDSGYYAQSLNKMNVYFGTENGKVYCRYGLTLSSVPANWQDCSFNSKINSLVGPQIEGTDKYLYLACENGMVYKINAETGATVWSYQAGGAVRAGLFAATSMASPDINSPFYNLNYIYFGCEDGNLYAVHKDTAGMKQGFPVSVGAEIKGSIKYDTSNHRVYFGANNGKIYCIQQ